jgi:hypothetical protein
MKTVVPTRGGIQILALVALSLSLLSGHAGAATITFDFEDQEKTSGPSDGALAFLVMSSMGLDVRLSRTSGAPFDIFNTAAFAIFPPGWGDRSLDPFVDVSRVGDRWLMEFARPIDSFSIQFGDVGPSDDDSPVSLQAFDDRFGLGNLIDSRTGTWPAEMSLPEFGTLSVAGAGIRSVLFGSEFVEATIFPNSLLWDNIVIETEERQAPEPTMGLLSALALAALGSRLGRARN